MPTSLDERRAVALDFIGIANFPNVIGAIDCTHIKIASPGKINLSVVLK